MTCRDVRELADSFLAEELLTETNHEILRHLETCPVCRADLAARRELREGLRRAFQQASDLGPSPAFLANLRATLETAAHKPARRGIRFEGLWALAATVLLAVAVGFVYGGREWLSATGALARAAAGDHRNCALQFRLAERPITLEEAARRYGDVYRVLETLPPRDVSTAAGVAHVLERHACVYNGRRFAHIVLEYRGAKVSLLVTEVDGRVQPRLPGNAFPQVTAAGRIDDVTVVSFRSGRHMVFFAGDISQSDLTTLADAIAEPLDRQLAGV
jgi:predicted anti-sigma-YlaC factor YlaD